MGKYMDEYNSLMERKSSLKRTHERIFNQYGHIMSPEAKAMNQASWGLSEKMYDRDIERAQKLAMKEMEEEVYQRVMKSLSVEVKDEASPAIREIRKQIENLFSK